MISQRCPSHQRADGAELDPGRPGGLARPADQLEHLLRVGVGGEVEVVGPSRPSSASRTVRRPGAAAWPAEANSSPSASATGGTGAAQVHGRSRTASVPTGGYDRAMSRGASDGAPARPASSAENASVRPRRLVRRRTARRARPAAASRRDERGRPGRRPRSGGRPGRAHRPHRPPGSAALVAAQGARRARRDPGAGGRPGGG